MQRELKQELASFGIVVINAIPILPSFVKKWLIRHVVGLTPLQAHILVERAKMWKPYGGSKTLWQYIMKRDNRVCQIRTKGVCTIVATQIDHVVPVFLFGTSTPGNLQAACQPCNRLKGIKILAEQASSKRMTAIIVIFLLTAIFLLFVVIGLVHLRL